jgi:hypothetical protein
MYFDRYKLATAGIDNWSQSEELTNSATFLRLSWGLVRHRQAVP